MNINDQSVYEYAQPGSNVTQQAVTNINDTGYRILLREDEFPPYEVVEFASLSDLIMAMQTVMPLSEWQEVRDG